MVWWHGWNRRDSNREGYVVVYREAHRARASGWGFSTVLGLLLLLAACNDATPTPRPTDSTASPTPGTPAGNGPAQPSEEVVLVVPLLERESSGKVGIAVITGNESMTSLVLMDRPITYATVEPAHVYTGTCEDLGGVVYVLKGILDGSATTQLDVPISKLRRGTYVINLHQSVATISNFIACGAIPAADDAVTVALTAPDGLGQSGHATLIRQGEKTWVAVSVAPADKGAAQPANIHIGSCANPGAIAHPLTDVVDGMSVTRVDAPLDEVSAEGFALALRHADGNTATYEACGETGQR